MEWQPIETAPKDGTMVFLWSGTTRAIGAVEGRMGWVYHWFDWDNSPDNEHTGPASPKNWMPLPEPPK